MKMGLVNPLQYIKLAKKQEVAVAAFNVHNLETVQAVVEGAEAEGAPVIIQTTPGTLQHAGISYIAAIVKTAAEKSNIPIALHLDHASSFEIIIQAIRNGYTSVMFDGSKLPYKENVVLTREIVKIAHAAGVVVEGELGKIGGTEDDVTVSEAEASFTVPEEAREYVESTGIDSLAVAIGTAHGVYRGKPKLDFERLNAINNIVEIPLVLHGASGIPDDSISRAIKGGITKINIATELKIPMARAIRECFDENPEENDPRHYLGLAKEAVKKVVREKIEVAGANKLKY